MPVAVTVNISMRQVQEAATGLTINRFGISTSLEGG